MPTINIIRERDAFRYSSQAGVYTVIHLMDPTESREDMTKHFPDVVKFIVSTDPTKPTFALSKHEAERIVSILNRVYADHASILIVDDMFDIGKGILKVAETVGFRCMSPRDYSTVDVESYALLFDAWARTSNMNHTLYPHLRTTATVLPATPPPALNPIPKAEIPALTHAPASPSVPNLVETPTRNLVEQQFGDAIISSSSTLVLSDITTKDFVDVLDETLVTMSITEDIDLCQALKAAYQTTPVGEPKKHHYRDSLRVLRKSLRCEDYTETAEVNDMLSYFAVEGKVIPVRKRNGSMVFIMESGVKRVAYPELVFKKSLIQSSKEWVRDIKAEIESSCIDVMPLDKFTFRPPKLIVREYGKIE